MKAILTGVPVGYGLKVLPIVTGPEASDDTEFEFALLGSQPLGRVDLDIGAGVPEDAPVVNGVPECSACDLKLAGTISNLSPGFKFLLKSSDSPTFAGQTDTVIDLDQLDGNGARDLNSTINAVKLGVLTWQRVGGFPGPNGEPPVQTVPQIQMDLKQVPSHVNIKISGNGKQEDSIVKACATTPNSLPTLDYNAEGNNGKADALDMNLRIDFTMSSDDMLNPDTDSPVIDVGVEDLSHKVHFENVQDGTFKISGADGAAKTKYLHLEMSEQTLGILDWDFSPQGCGTELLKVGPVTIETAGGLKFSLRTGIVIDARDFRTLEVSPGIIVDVSGDYSEFAFQLRDPNLVDTEIGGLGLKIRVHIADGINPAIPIGTTPSLLSMVPIPVDVDFIDFSSDEKADWIDVNLLVPCDVDVSWDGVDITAYHAHITTTPGVLASTTNGFRATNTAHYLILPYLGELLGEFFAFFINPLIVFFDQLIYGEGSFGAHIGCPN